MIRPVALALFLALVPPATSRAAEARRPWITARARAWVLHGSQDSRYGSISPNFTTSGGGPVWTGTSLNTHLRGVVPVGEVEVAPLEWLSVEGEYGTAGVSAPNAGISAWLDAPNEATVQNINSGAVWSHPSHVEYIRAAAGGDSAKTTWSQVNLCFRVAESRAGEDSALPGDSSLDVLAGAERFTDQFTLQDALVTYSNSAVPNFFAAGSRFPGAFYGVTSTWRGPHLGARAETPMPAGARIESLVLWSPLMEYRGNIYDFVNAGGASRSESPNIEERAHGTAIHLRLGAQWRWRGLSLDAGWQRLYFYSRTGLRRTYNRNGTVSDLQLDHAITERAGFYTGASYRF